MPLDTEIQAALARAEKAALLARHEGAFWEGELELNASPSAQFVLTCALLTQGERYCSRETAWGVAQYLLESLAEGQGLKPYPGQKGNRSWTFDAALALRVIDLRWGWPTQSEKSRVEGVLEITKRFLREEAQKKPAPPLFRSTATFLGLWGVLSWNQVPKFPLAFLALPQETGIDLTAYWIRTVAIPMALLGSLSLAEVTAKEPPEARALQAEFGPLLGPERHPPTWRRLQQKAFESFQRFGSPRLLRAAAETRIAAFTESQGDIAGNPYAAFFSSLYWDRLRSPSSEQLTRLDRAMRAVREYAIIRSDLQKPSQWRLQTNLSTIWDTGFFLCAFPQKTPELQNAAQWLLTQQIRDREGDWARRAHALPAGFSFGRGHDHYPVTDCTALAILALVSQLGRQWLSSPEGWASARFLLAFQAENGGFAPYEKPRLRKPELWNQVFSIQDIPNQLFDRTKADVTGKVCEALALFRDHAELISEHADEHTDEHAHELAAQIRSALTRARAFLLHSRDEEGLWKGNYGVNRLYGTCFAVRGLRAIDREAQAEWARPAQEFFVSMQNPDGGWGELEDQSRCSSSAVQTAWALMGLSACKTDHSNATWHRASQRGIRYLLSTQNHQHGLWDEPRHLGIVFEKTVNFRYEFYPAYFPMIALREHLEAFDNSHPSPFNSQTLT